MLLRAAVATTAYAYARTQVAPKRIKVPDGCVATQQDCGLGTYVRLYHEYPVYDPWSVEEQWVWQSKVAFYSDNASFVLSKDGTGFNN